MTEASNARGRLEALVYCRIWDIGCSLVPLQDAEKGRVVEWPSCRSWHTFTPRQDCQGMIRVASLAACTESSGKAISQS